MSAPLSATVRQLLRELAGVGLVGGSRDELERHVEAIALRLARMLGDVELEEQLGDVVRLRALLRAGRAPSLEQIQRSKNNKGAT